MPSDTHDDSTPFLDEFNTPIPTDPQNEQQTTNDSKTATPDRKPQATQNSHPENEKSVTLEIINARILQSCNNNEYK